MEPASNEGAASNTLMDADQLSALEPRFGAWLEAHTIPADMRTPFWTQGWAAELFFECLVAGTASDLGPFLAEIAALAASEPGTFEYGQGWKFASHLHQRCTHADRWFNLDETVLPPILRYAWNDLLHSENRHDRWSYGRY